MRKDKLKFLFFRDFFRIVLFLSADHTNLMQLKQKIFFFFSLVHILFFGFYLNAAEFKVKKSKGHTYLIESEVNLKEGQIYQIKDQLLDDLKSLQKRTNSIQLALDFYMLKGQRLQESGLSLNARYGWNFEDYELGPLIAIELFDEGEGSNSKTGFGGFFDYNFIPNINFENFIYGLTAQLSAGNFKSTNAGDAQILSYSAGFFASIFLNNTNLALRSELLALSQQIKTTSSQARANGFVGQFVFQYYFD